MIDGLSQMMPPEAHKEIELRHFIESRLTNDDYMSSHSLEDVKKSALRRRNTENFDDVWNPYVNA
ncbi:MAG: hypothetical protein WAM14_00580, partial [Candidatus Nitrosopolaris sp.]